MAEATVPHGKSSARSCLVCTVLACVPARARRAPAELCCRQSRRPISARSTGSRRATPSPTASTATARTPALPSRPRRQEAAEPVPLHGGGRHLIDPCSVLFGVARPTGFCLTGLDSTHSVPFGCTPPGYSAPLVSPRSERDEARGGAM